MDENSEGFERGNATWDGIWLSVVLEVTTCPCVLDRDKGGPRQRSCAQYSAQKRSAGDTHTLLVTVIIGHRKTLFPIACWRRLPEASLHHPVSWGSPCAQNVFQNEEHL
jgi:hypothetical protein